MADIETVDITPTGNWNYTGGDIKVPTPTQNTDAVTKLYADTIAPTTLTNDSLADALHRHSELSASDGTPNPALSVDASGNVGIGTAGPSNKLTVADTNITDATPDSGNLYIYTTDFMAIDKGGKIMLGGSYSDTTRYGFASISGRKENGSNTNPAGYFAISTMETDVGHTEKMRITSTGNVGINDVAPAEKLDVNGNINLTGVLKIDDVQVLKERQVAITDAKADYVAGDLDTEAEIITAINATNAKINAILLMLETHGLIAS